ncbi:uncharacterized protein [Temnothorax longispinosus]|uniref:uncharacterized protein n=1 Tax=Temnothorax longispinosus TaxID=300112 RepID=UPI003A9A32E5
MLKISSRLPPESYQKLSKWIHVKDILGTFFLVMQGCIYYSRGPEYLVFHVLATYIGLLMFHMDMQYVNCACVLKACFKRINDSLMHLQNFVVNNEPYAPNLICDMQKNQFLLIELKTLKKQHLIVSNTMQMLNVIFSLQLLVTIALTFTDITFEVYRHVTQWQNGLSIILNDKTRDPFFLMSVAYSLLKLILIVWICETGKNQAFEIGTTVHDVFNCTSDEQIKEEMTGSITTYVLILAQFMVMSHSCDRDTRSNITQITYLEEDT